MAHAFSDRYIPPIVRNGALAFLCIALPLTLHWIVMKWTVGGFTSGLTVVDPATIKLRSVYDPIHEFPKRMDFGLAATLFLIAAMIGLTCAVVRILGSRGTCVALAALTISIISGGIVFIADEHIRTFVCPRSIDDSGAVCGYLLSSSNSPGTAMRAAAVTAIVTAARESESMQFFTSGLVAITNHVLLLAATTAAFGVAAVMALAIYFATIAWRAGAETDAANVLRLRWRGLRHSVVLGGIILALAVVATRAFYQWPTALLDDEFAKSFAAVTSAASGYWGAFYSLLLLAVAGPAILAIHLDIEAEADAQGPDPRRREEWRKENHLTFSPQEAVSGILAAAAPLLTSPAIDALQSIFGG